MAKGSSGIGNSNYAKAIKNLKIEGSAGVHTKEATQIINGTRKVLKDFGMDDLNSIVFDADMKGSASMNGFGDLSISTIYLSQGNMAKEGWFTSDTYEGTGTHEAGHYVVNELLKNNVMTNAKPLAIATARNKGKLENKIIKEAQKRFGSNPSISGYGERSVKEKVAEAVADVYSNKNPNPYSKVIVGVMKDIKNGKFKPKL